MDLRSYRCELELFSADFDRGFEYEKRCREVCSPPLHTGPKKKHSFDFVPGKKNQIESEPNFLSKVITGDESWCYAYDPETKRASRQWKTPTSPRPKKQDRKRCSLFYFRCSRNRAQGIRSSWTDCQSGILLGGFEAIVRECAKKTPRIVEIG